MEQQSCNAADPALGAFDPELVDVPKPDSPSAAVALHNATVLAEQQKLLDRAEAGRALLESVLRQMPAGVIISEAPSGRTIFTNLELEKILGCPPPKCTSIDDYKRYSGVHPDGRPFETGDYAHVRALTGEVSVNHEAQFVRADGTRRVASVTSAPIRNGEGQIIAAVSTLLDVTADERAREELRLAKEAAEKANSAKDQFLAVLSHELRTPLTPVLALLSMLDARTDIPEALRDDLGLIRRNVELEARLIDDLLDLTRIARGKIELHMEPVDIHEVIRAAMQTCCRDEIDSRKIEVVLGLEAQRHRVKGDPGRLQQVFWNLLGNAVKFSPGGGMVRVRSFERNGRLHVEISDNGIGIDPELLPRIFNAFEQGDQSTTRRFGGLGLGLAICRAIVELHGGAIVARSGGPGTGATFAVELTPCQETATAPMAPAEPRSATSPGIHILLVEDHEDTAKIMARLLAGKGYQVTTAASAAEALKHAETQRFDLLVSDLGLPDRSGFELMEELRRQRPIPGIALSGFGMDEDVERSKAAGFAQHLTKPVNFQSLLNSISRLTA
ncbi:MAG TPA: ATP-binding protein [Tepidisphaeraceae bacterium]|nr:ATP-binding protein [Tepidisphaeraceae bacterium]